MVPVLSVQIISVLPSVSTLDIFLTIAFFLAKMFIPTDKMTVMTAGKPSGMAATASDIARRSASVIRISFIIQTINMRKITIEIIIVSTLLIPLIFFCRGVSSTLVLSKLPAILPISASIPVAVTIYSPLPYTTLVPAYTILFRSFRATSFFRESVLFKTATDSPVRLASSTFKELAINNLPSAAILSPASNRTISPLTNSSLFKYFTIPSLLTFTLVVCIFFNDSIASSAFCSSKYPKMALIKTISKIMILSK